MGIGKKVVLILVTTITGINLMACNKSSNDKISTTETNYYSATIDGDKIYYSEDDTDTVGVKELVDNILNVLVATDYRNENYLKEFDYYTKEKQEINEQYGVKALTKDYVISSELIKELNSYDIKSIEFYNLKDEKNATVIIEYADTVINATEEYLERKQTELNKQEKKGVSFTVVKEDGQWRLYDYKALKLEE